MSYYSQLPKQLNFAAALLSRTETRRANTAFYYRAESFTYEVIDNYVKRAATYFLKKGVQREQRIAILLPNSPSFIVAFLGTIWMGAVAVPIHPELPLETILYILSDCRAKHIVTNVFMSNKLFSKKPDLKEISTLVDGEVTWFEDLMMYPQSLHSEMTSKDEPAYWLYTSGTTGVPKGVVHLHHDPLVLAESYANKTLKIHSQDVLYATSSMAFAYGLGCSLYMPMYVGASSILVGKSDLFDFTNVIQNCKPTLFFSVPVFFNAALEFDRCEKREFDFSSVRMFVSAGEPLSVTLCLAWMDRFGKPLLDALGATEVSHVFIANTPDDYRMGSIGKPIDGFSCLVKNEKGEILGPNQTGHLWVSADCLMVGYWNRYEETRDVFCGKYLCTKDLVFYDEDGFFWYVSRSDSLLKVQGGWVVPVEIEEVLLKHPAVLEVAVTRIIAQEKRGFDQIGASIVLRKGVDSARALQDIALFARKNLSSEQIPKSFTILEKLPRTVNGKVRKNELEQRVQTYA
ncbi:MAG: hypothetical protein A3F67_01280 [Verrucomicrobia bacterium RIFCSPHIGHO2_12_FULL_41_10]|nr:MAG: hypothetical protein A3F67_01280 [Verrucomicrobia bacterium RIFCSPHIGHO2_12_FULL_41_10]